MVFVDLMAFSYETFERRVLPRLAAVKPLFTILCQIAARLQNVAVRWRSRIIFSDVTLPVISQ
jgi:hypothetical protein